jgi:hypothetical protein
MDFLCDMKIHQDMELIEKDLNYLLETGKELDTEGQNEKALEQYMKGLELSIKTNLNQYTKIFSQLIITLL